MLVFSDYKNKKQRRISRLYYYKVTAELVEVIMLFGISYLLLLGYCIFNKGISLHPDCCFFIRINNKKGDPNGPRKYIDNELYFFT